MGDQETSSEGRNNAFSAGVTGASGSSFSTRQQGAGAAGYRKTSVLDTLTPSGLGYSGPDRSRLLANGEMLSSPNGQSPETYGRSSWLQSPYRPIG